jgi:hypothetical protein
MAITLVSGENISPTKHSFRSIFAYRNINAAIVFLLLFYGAMKDDTSSVIGSAFWSELKWSPIVFYTKKFSFLALPIISCLGAYFIARSKKLFVGINTCGWLLWSLMLYAALRTVAEGKNADVKIIIGSLTSLAIAIYFNIVISNIGLVDAKNRGFAENATKGIFYYAIFLVAINFVNVVTGNGYVPGNPRLFGTSAHPNFLGVQLGIGLVAVTYYTVFLNQSFGRIVSAFALIAGIYLLICTGSRTGMIVFATGTALALWARTRFSFYWLIAACIGALCLLPIVLILTAHGQGGFAESYAREGDANTRAEAWNYLISIIQDRPLFGLGHFVLFSENSLLRGWASYGIIFAAIFVFSFFYALYMSGKQLLQRRFNAHICLLFGLIGGLATGSLLEGYLVDIMSPQIFIWYISIICIGEPLIRIQAGTFRQAGNVPKLRIVRQLKQFQKPEPQR